MPAMSMNTKGSTTSQRLMRDIQMQFLKSKRTVKLNQRNQRVKEMKSGKIAILKMWMKKMMRTQFLNSKTRQGNSTKMMAQKLHLISLTQAMTQSHKIKKNQTHLQR